MKLEMSSEFVVTMQSNFANCTSISSPYGAWDWDFVVSRALESCDSEHPSKTGMKPLTILPVSQMRETLAACRELALDYNIYP